MDRVHFSEEMEVTMPWTSSGTASASDWRSARASLVGRRVALRELRPSDAAPLCALLTAPEVSRFIAPPPATIQSFEHFITQSNRDGNATRAMCLAVTLVGDDAPIGIFQIREIEPNFHVAEWGFALGSAFWGTGVFTEAAELVLEFVFEGLGVHRLEARAAVRNGRGGRALQKVGAVPEGVLRKAFLKDGCYLDQVMYSIIADDWRASRGVRRTPELAAVH
jgi:ribosomal-protein-alanine N-acetyltransferase